MNPGLSILALLSALIAAIPATSQTSPDLQATTYAIRDARVVVEPGTILPRATVVIRDGLISDVGPDVAIPADAGITEGKGLTVYPGFLDAGSTRGYDPALRRSQTGPPALEDIAADFLAATKPDNRKGLTPEFAVQSALKLDEEAIAPWRRVGFTANLAVPEGGYLSGSSALMSLSGAVPRDAILRAPVALHARFGRVLGPEYPTALMGVIAHCRQTFLDAGWLKRQWTAYEGRGRTGKRPPADPGLESLWPALEGKLPVAFEADSVDEIHRALDFSAEFKLKPMIVGGRNAWKVVDRLKLEHVPVVLRLDFSSPGDREAELPVRVREEREQLRLQEIGCAAALHQAGIPFAFMTQGLAGNNAPSKFRDNMRKVIAAGLPTDAALAALTRDAADILGVAPQIGRITKGRPAHLVVCEGDFEAAATKYRFAFADGVRFDLDEKAAPPAGAALTEAPPLRKGPRVPPVPETTPSRPTTSAGSANPPTGLGRSGQDRTAAPFSGNAYRAIVPLLDAAEASFTERREDRTPLVKTCGNVLIRNTTILTAKGETLLHTDLLVKAGKIHAIGSDLLAEKNMVVLDGEGLFVMPGIIDTHSHFAINGGVNEASLSVVPEVRVRDVIDSEDVQIYRALGGGVTTARLLHGSANVIGGQDAVVKMKYGRSVNEMLVPNSPRGVKFALGENVKRTDGRFPNSRLGVEAVLVRAFTEAQTYRKKWYDYERSKGTNEPLPEPRRDLRLEALADVLAGDLRIHSHCYRSDEILMLLRVAERFGVKVRSLQHVLEGYKVAPEIAAHGASVSLFSDWWAYKMEAYDAIPYGARLLHDSGVNVCLKSDDNELMRHLNQEAAKLVKYCNFTPDEALQTITRNPARQLGLDGRLGTIEIGKDADLAIFNGHPLNSYSRCEMTLVEGEVFFQRSDKMISSAPAQVSPAKPAAKFTAIPELPRGIYVLRGGTIHSPGRAPFEGTVVVDAAKSKIVDVAAGSKFEAPAGAHVVDVAGLHIYPGMIDAGTVLGLVEIDSARETADFRDGGDFQPDLRASVGINPDSELIPVTRANGVTTVVTRPTGSVVPGQGALINLAGWVPAQMIVVDPLSLHVEYPGEPTSRGFNPNLAIGGDGESAAMKWRRQEKLNKLKEIFELARLYDAAKLAGNAPPANPRLESLLPYIRGEKPVIFTAERQTDIVAALKLADELKVKPILSGGTEAWKLAAELKRRDVAVILGPIMSLPREQGDRYDASYVAAAKLYQAGVRFCIRSAGSNNTRNLPYEAALAVAYGLPPEEALRAVTLYPAEILGVADKLGTIESGKRANLVIANSDILQASTQVLAVFIDGQPYEPTSKQTRLYDKYRKRLDEIQNQPTPKTESRP